MTKQNVETETTAEEVGVAVDDAKRIRFIEMKRRELSRATRGFEEAKLDADSAKKKMERAQVAYNAAGEPEDPPLLDVGDTDSVGWRKLGIDALEEHGVPAAALQKMAAAEILTLGDYSEFCSKNIQGPQALDGIGLATADKIGDAWLAFFAAHEEYCQPEADANPEGDGEEVGDG